MKEELTSAIQALAKGKSPRPDGLMADFFKACWSFMSVDFAATVNESLGRGWFRRELLVDLLLYSSKKGID